MRGNALLRRINQRLTCVCISRLQVASCKTARETATATQKETATETNRLRLLNELSVVNHGDSANGFRRLSLL